MNSVVISVSATALSLLLNSMAGYAFAKLRFKGQDTLFTFMLASLVIPSQVAIIPLFLILKSMGLINTYAGVVLPGIVGIFGIFFIRQYAFSIPDSLIEAARIDGAGEFQIYRTIFLPLLKPVLVTLAIFKFMAIWNDFLWPLVVLTDDDKYTLPVALASFSREYIHENELMMAGSVITILPILVVFLSLQKYYIKGMMLGGMKG